MGDTEGPPKGFVGVYHQMLALQWYIRAKARSRLDCDGEENIQIDVNKEQVIHAASVMVLNNEDLLVLFVRCLSELVLFG